MVNAKKIAEQMIANLRYQKFSLLQHIVRAQTAAEVANDGAPPSPATPSPATPHDDVYRRLQRESPYIAAHYFLNHSVAIFAERSKRAARWPSSER